MTAQPFDAGIGAGAGGVVGVAGGSVALGIVAGELWAGGGGDEERGKLLVCLSRL